MRRHEPASNPGVRWGSRARLSGPAAVLGGGLIGSALRSGLTLAIQRSDGGFPTATLIANLLGSLAIGIYIGRRQRSVTRPSSVDFWGIGLLGSFTTFSAFSVETIDLLAGGRGVVAIVYVATSLVGGLSLAFIGDRASAR